VAETTASSPRALRRRWAPAEKRRIVELTLHAGASVAAIAREHGVNRSNLRQWQSLYRAGKLDLQGKSASAAAGPTTSVTFVPVNVVRPVRRSPMAAHFDSQTSKSVVVQLVLATGATLRLETGSLDAALVCALVAELQR
jgi:transposase-like protein